MICGIFCSEMKRNPCWSLPKCACISFVTRELWEISGDHFDTISQYYLNMIRILVGSQ